MAVPPFSSLQRPQHLRGHIKRAEIKSREMLDSDQDTEQAPNHAHSPSLSDSYLPAQLGCTQQSLSCSVIIEGRSSHSRQSSVSSNFDHFMGTQGEKENLAETWGSVVEQTEMEQSYSHMLGVLEAAKGHTDKQAKQPGKPGKGAEPGSPSKVLSDCSSLFGSSMKTPLDLSLTDPVFSQTAMERSFSLKASPIDARTSTIYTNLSSDSPSILSKQEAYQTPTKASPTLTSPYGATTVQSESHLLEIDLYESCTLEPQVAESSSILGVLPARAFCPNCRTDVSTRVSFETPAQPL